MHHCGMPSNHRRIQQPVSHQLDVVLVEKLDHVVAPRSRSSTKRRIDHARSHASASSRSFPHRRARLHDHQALRVEHRREPGGEAVRGGVPVAHRVGRVAHQRGRHPHGDAAVAQRPADFAARSTPARVRAARPASGSRTGPSRAGTCCGRRRRRSATRADTGAPCPRSRRRPARSRPARRPLPKLRQPLTQRRVVTQASPDFHHPHDHSSLSMLRFAPFAAVCAFCDCLIAADSAPLPRLVSHVPRRAPAHSPLRFTRPRRRNPPVLHVRCLRCRSAASNATATLGAQVATHSANSPSRRGRPASIAKSM